MRQCMKKHFIRIGWIKACLFSEAIALDLATFGQGDRPIHLDEVACMGNETRLAECQHLGNVSHDCTHIEDAGVICQGEYTNTYTMLLKCIY